MILHPRCFSSTGALHCQRSRRGGASFRVHSQSRRSHYSRHAMYPSCPIGHRLQSNLLPRFGIRFGVILFRFAASQNDEFAALFIPRHKQFHRNYKVNCCQRSASPSPPGMVVSVHTAGFRLRQISNAFVKCSSNISLMVKKCPRNFLHASTLAHSSLSLAHLPTV